MEGYITLALDRQIYYDMAVNLARSVRYFDKARPICLLHNAEITIDDLAGSCFDYIIEMPHKEGYLGCANKFRVFEHSPFEKSMYIDADCMMVLNDIDRHWRRCTGYFSITGDKTTSGKWYDLDIAKVCANFGIPYVVEMNSGVFVFDKSAEAAKFFDHLDGLFANHRNSLSKIHQGREGQYADEPLFGTAMGQFSLEPVDAPPNEGAWMISTWQARNCFFDPANNIARIDKPTGHYWNCPILPRGWVRHSPTIAHFIGLRPQRSYRDLAEFFRLRSA
jgi:hypothetical protein